MLAKHGRDDREERKEVIRQRLESASGEIRQGIEDLEEELWQRVQPAVVAVESTVHRLEDGYENFKGKMDVEAHAQRSPFATVAAAAGAGLLIGAMVRLFPERDGHLGKISARLPRKMGGGGIGQAVRAMVTASLAELASGYMREKFRQKNV
jgi:ElaB/YqjD/DUF883 family membrane-anchored ribosome-binding protein